MQSFGAQGGDELNTRSGPFWASISPAANMPTLDTSAGVIVCLSVRVPLLLLWKISTDLSEAVARSSCESRSKSAATSDLKKLGPRAIVCVLVNLPEPLLSRIASVHALGSLHNVIARSGMWSPF